MSTTETLTETISTRVPHAYITAAKSDVLKFDGTDRVFGDWRDDLIRDGFAVIKGAIPRDRAEKYGDAMYSWLEGL